MTDTGTLVQPSLKELKRLSKSFEAIQQSFLIGLLNIKGTGFKFRKPERKSQKTMQTLIIEEISDEQGTQNYQELLKQHCSMLTNQELIKAGFPNLRQEHIETIASITKLHYNEEQTDVLKQIKRHKDANNLSLAFNWLFDRAKENKITFKERSTKPSKLTIQMLKINEAEDEESGYHFMKEDIENFGTKVSKYISNGFDGAEKMVELQPKDNEIIRMYNEMVNRLGQDNGRTEIVRRETIFTQPSITTVQNDVNMNTNINEEGNCDDNDLVVQNPDQSTFELSIQPCPSIFSNPSGQIQYQPIPVTYSHNQYTEPYYIPIQDQMQYTDAYQYPEQYYDPLNGFQQGFTNNTF